MPLPPDAAAALARLETFGTRLGLDRMRRLLGALGEPQRGLPAVLVAGTNGKGSTAALLAAVGRAAGYRTGLYTSPHLETVEERLRVGGDAIAGEVLGELVLEAVAAGERSLAEPPTYFEVLTAAAFLHFRRSEVELAVLEVGLGGRLDATNTADPAVSVITPIALEHREHLGDTLAAIAREKAGVMRPGRPTVAWADEPAVTTALAAAAAAAGAQLVPAERRASIGSVGPRIDAPWGGQEVVLETARGPLALAVPLLGEHQAVNLAIGWAAAEAMAAGGWSRLDAAAFRGGAARWRWPGRLEVVELPGARPCRRVLLDGAHNPHGARALARFLAAPPTPFPRPPVMLFGALADKDAGEMLAALAPLAGELILTRPPHERGRAPDTLRATLPRGSRAEDEPDHAVALERALAVAGDRGADTVVVCGSLYLVGAVRTALRERFGVPAP
ncbi:MAG TPA: Mur ligase family protein [Thermoanaerobaculia bacterium]|nr:Mur ligase family protein [Thermoanaerobaculia bacterium]